MPRPQQRSLVRAAITLLVQRPLLATSIEPPWTFAELRQPGIGLLVELIELCRMRPGITTGALLEHFAERDEAGSLQKLAVSDDFPGGEDEAHAEFLGSMAQLDRQTETQRRVDLQQRLRELEAKGVEGLGEAEKNELRGLLSNRTTPRA